MPDANIRERDRDVGVGILVNGGSVFFHARCRATPHGLHVARTLA